MSEAVDSCVEPARGILPSDNENARAGSRGQDVGCLEAVRSV
jgi:hypothetical protein